MTGEEKFAFDLEGYLIIKNVLSTLMKLRR